MGGPHWRLRIHSAPETARGQGQGQGRALGPTESPAWQPLRVRGWPWPLLSSSVVARRVRLRADEGDSGCIVSALLLLDLAVTALGDPLIRLRWDQNVRLSWFDID